MKTKIGFFSMLLLAGALTVNAQGGPGGPGGFQRRTPEENTKRVVDTLNTVFKLDQGAQTQVQSVFMDFYKAQNKMMDDMMASGGQMDRDKMRADREKMTADRDEKLKKALGEENFKKFKSDIEPALSPRRRMGGQ